MSKDTLYKEGNFAWGPEGKEGAYYAYLDANQWKEKKQPVQEATCLVNNAFPVTFQCHFSIIIERKPWKLQRKRMVCLRRKNQIKLYNF